MQETQADCSRGRSLDARNWDYSYNFTTILMVYKDVYIIIININIIIIIIYFNVIFLFVDKYLSVWDYDISEKLCWRVYYLLILTACISAL